MLNLESVVTFDSIADAGSLAAAARKVGVSKSVVSARLSDLERALGVTPTNALSSGRGLRVVGPREGFAGSVSRAGRSPGVNPRTDGPGAYSPGLTALSKYLHVSIMMHIATHRVSVPRYSWRANPL